MPDDPELSLPRDPRRMFIAIFAVLCLLLGAGYYTFLRDNYAVLYSQLKPSDAAAIVAVLEAKGIPHKLRDGGTTVLVPSDQADNGQVAVAGSDVPLKGSVGFELFNKSDMGLTDFAQKIDYQRALQGELARTIMMMDGVENARVHLALPGHSLFRSQESAPRAAVEVMMRDGQALDADRVAGLQQLVAASVPDLPIENVVVLDNLGRVASASPSMQYAGAADTEQAAVQNYYSVRAKTALNAAMPGVDFGVHTLVLAQSDAVTGGGGGISAPATVDAEPTTDLHSGKRNFSLRMIVLTPAPLNADDQELVRKTVADAVALDTARGDSLSIEVGPASSGLPARAPAATPISPTTTGAPAAAAEIAPAHAASRWIVLLVAFAALAIAWLIIRGRDPGVGPGERDAFIARLRQQLRATDGEAHD